MELLVQITEIKCKRLLKLLLKINLLVGGSMNVNRSGAITFLLGMKSLEKIFANVYC